MPEIPFCGPAYKLDTVNAAGDRCINLIPEKIEKGPRVGKYRLKGIPGLSVFKSLPAAPLRALWSNATRCFAVAGGGLWEIFADATPSVFIGPLANGTNPAIIVSNGQQLAIASAGEAFLAPGVGVIPIVDTFGAPVLAGSIAFLDQYFIASPPNTNQIFISHLAPNGNIWDPGDTAFAEAYSDNIVRVWVDQPGGEYLWLFGNETTEVWADTAGLFPFSRIPGDIFSIGCDSAWSVAGVAGWRAWLWKGVVWGCTGFNPQRISDFGVEQAIQGYSLFDQETAEAFAWVDGGHIFYSLSFPIAGRTWVYDLSTQMWHERLYYFNGQYGRYRPRVYAKAFGRHLVGDYATGTIYSMDPNVYTDAPAIATPAGAPVALRRSRICPDVRDSMKNDRYNRLTIDMDTGIGLSVPDGQIGNNPQVMLKYSKNRGKTWSSERQVTAGKIGEDDTRVIFNQLGSSRIGMTFDVAVSDPVPTNFNAAYVDIGPGTSPGDRP